MGKAIAFGALAIISTLIACWTASAAVVEYDIFVIESNVDYKSPGKWGLNIPQVPLLQQVMAVLVNGQYPGVTIYANEGDTIRVNLTNYLYISGDTSIHWHGMHQRGTPFMDGVPGITQCGIAQYDSFIYEFEAYPPGSRIYHAHTRDQTELGMSGAMVIYPTVDPLAGQYTSDQVFLITDLYPDPIGTTLYLLGQGRTFINGVRGENYTISNGAYPFPLFNVTENECTRLRVMFAGGESHGFDVRFAGHTVTIVSVDGNDIIPVPGQTGFILAPGERVDVLVCGTETPGNYPIRIDTQWSPANNHPPSFAFLHYASVSDIPTMEGVGTGGGANAQFAPHMQSWLYVNGWSQFELATYKQGPPQGIADQVFTVKAAYATNQASNVVLPPGWQAFYGFSLADDRHIGVMSDTPYLHTRGLNQQCIPAHANIETIWNASTVDIIINSYLDAPGNFTGIAHPMHLHGFDFWVLGVGTFLDPSVVTDIPIQFYDPNITARAERCGHALDAAANCQYTDSIDRAKLNFINPPLKDTVILPPGSWVYLRVVMDNPGVWFFHCHIGGHMETGMIKTFNVMPYSQPALPADTVYCGVCRPDIDQLYGITPCPTCQQCAPSTPCQCQCNCPAAQSCPSSSSSPAVNNQVENVVNVNFANMFNGLTLT